MRNKTKSQGPHERIWRARLHNLCQMRFGNHFLPDNDKGRAMLTALLRFGLTDDSAIADALWCEAELQTLKRKGRRLKWRDVGRLVGLTFDEWKAAKLWVARPVDVSEADLETWRKQQRKASWSKSKQKAREMEAEQKQVALARARAKPLKPRQAFILKMLVQHNGRPMTVAELTKRASKSNAFTPASYRDTTWCGGPPKHAIVRNLPFVVRRTLEQLKAKGIIETYKRSGKREPEIRAKLNICSFSTTKGSSTRAH
jgi:hypothetical protein